MSHPAIYVIDFGAQYSKLIARRIREVQVYSEILPPSISPQELKNLNPKGLILSGGPKSVHEAGSPTIDSGIYDIGVPVLGICYGAQLMAQQLGGEVDRSGKGEYGRTKLSVLNSGTLFAPDTQGEVQVWMSHFDGIQKLPEEFLITSSSQAAPIASFENPKRKLYGVQFHPEVVHTECGKDIFERFVKNICSQQPSWDTKSIIEESVAEITEQIGNGRAVCGLSGGVDSAVAAALVHKSVGDRLKCVFVDTGLMRKGEAKQIQETFSKPEMPELITIDASRQFFKKLSNQTDPEKKRKIVGKCFIQAFEKAAKDLGDIKFLVQGTLYPDVIESGAAKDHLSTTIKTHHNVGGLPKAMKLELVEPLRHLFKDEVRIVGEALGLPEEIVWRQPFPGPGLAVRIIGEVTPEKAATLAEADAIVREEITILEKEVWQAFAVLLDLKTVGVMGDERTYAYPIIIRAVSSQDAMTADWVRVPDELLEKMSSRIVNEVPGINRVAYDITSKPPGTIEWE